jgi:hypothetical protein
LTVAQAASKVLIKVINVARIGLLAWLLVMIWLK